MRSTPVRFSVRASEMTGLVYAVLGGTTWPTSCPEGIAGAWPPTMYASALARAPPGGRGRLAGAQHPCAWPAARARAVTYRRACRGSSLASFSRENSEDQRGRRPSPFREADPRWSFGCLSAQSPDQKLALQQARLVEKRAWIV